MRQAYLKPVHIKRRALISPSELSPLFSWLIQKKSDKENNKKTFQHFIRFFLRSPALKFIEMLMHPIFTNQRDCILTQPTTWWLCQLYPPIICTRISLIKWTKLKSIFMQPLRPIKGVNLPQTTGEWNGLVRDLLEDRADIIVTTLAVTQASH